MRWFKHLTNDTEEKVFVAQLEALFGLEGYGRWNHLLEKIGEVMGGDNGCSATYPWAEWQTFLKGKRNKLRTFLVHLEDKGRINLKETGNILEIECPNLKHLRDEYSRKSGQHHSKGQDIVPSQSTENRLQKTKREGADPPPPDSVKNGITGGSRGVYEFLQYAVASHQKVRRSKMVDADKITNVERVKRWIEIDGLSVPVLCRCWDAFLEDPAPWLAGRPRTITIFGSRLEDYLLKTRAVEQEEWSKQEPTKNGGDAEMGIEKYIRAGMDYLKEDPCLERAESLLQMNQQYTHKNGRSFLSEKEIKECREIMESAEKRSGEIRVAQMKADAADRKEEKNKKLNDKDLQAENKKQIRKLVRSFTKTG